MIARIGIILTMIPWVAAAGQVSRSGPTTARAGVAPAPVSTPVAAAALRGLIELSLAQGSKVNVRSAPQGLGSAYTGHVHSYRRETRESKQVLVETTYSVKKNSWGYPVTKVVGERIYPGVTKLILTGPWALGPWGSHYLYLLRPIDQAVRIAKPPARSLSVPELGGGAKAPASGWVAQSVTAEALENIAPSGASCDVPINPKAIGAEDELQQLACLLLQNGQGVTLSGGTRLFRRSANIEIWQGDQLMESVNGLAVRDGKGRHWLLQPIGYF